MCHVVSDISKLNVDIGMMHVKMTTSHIKNEVIRPKLYVLVLNFEVQIILSDLPFIRYTLILMDIEKLWDLKLVQMSLIDMMGSLLSLLSILSKSQDG